MRNVIFLINMSLDGFIAGPNGAMDWIASDDDIWDDVIALQNTADAALFSTEQIELEPIRVVNSPGVTHLQYRVVKQAG